MELRLREERKQWNRINMYDIVQENVTEIKDQMCILKGPTGNLAKLI